MIRSKLSTKAILLAAGIGLSTAAFAGWQPAAAQAYTCPDGLAYNPSYGCTLGGGDYGYWDGGYYGYPAILRGHPDHYGSGHVGIGADGTIVHHGMGFRSIGVVGHGLGGMGRAAGVDRGFSAAHFGGAGFAHAGGLGGFHGGGFHGGGGFGGGGHR